MNENEFQFVMDCDVEALVSYLQEDYHLSLSDAFEKVYSSKVFFEENLHLIISKLRIKKWQFS